MIRIELGQTRKYRNAREYRTIQTASALGKVASGDGDVIAALCRDLQAAGHTGEVCVFRDGTPVFSAVSLDVWAAGKALTGSQPEHLRRRA